jgi:ABC-type transport system involved in multi-copper enzyme maturation permease subunit
LTIPTVTDPNANPIPDGVRAIAALFALCGVYLAIVAILMLARPGAISMTAGAPLLFGLELAGPYMFLLIAVAAGGIAWGLMRLNNIMRHAAILAACAGIVMLVPPVSGAVVTVEPGALIRGGFGIIIRVIVAWYLSQAHIADQFKAPRPSSQ